MDIEMPRINGLEACKLLKQNQATKHIPVILLTLRAEESFVRQGHENGCTEFLTKPVKDQGLIAAVKTHLGE